MVDDFLKLLLHVNYLDLNQSKGMIVDIFNEELLDKNLENTVSVNIFQNFDIFNTNDFY